MFRRGWSAALAQLGRHHATTPVAASLYVGPGCGLCEEALVLLKPFVERGELSITKVDVSTNAELFRAYCFSIPVLRAENGCTLTWPFDRHAIRRLLR